MGRVDSEIGEGEEQEKPPATGSQGSDRRRRRGRLAWKGSLFSKKKKSSNFWAVAREVGRNPFGPTGWVVRPEKINYLMK